MDTLIGRLVALDPARRDRLRGMLADRGTPRRGPAPASFFQERLWLHDQLEPGSTAYLVPLAVRIRGELDVALLRQALDAVVRRHDILRTALLFADGTLTQHVHEHVDVPFELIDLSTLTDVRPAVAEALATATATGFDLATAPLLRVRLLRLATRDHVLVIVLHHAITDGWSNGILLEELGTAYTAAARGGTPDWSAVPLRYADTAAEQRAGLTPERTADLVAHWAGRLIGAPDPLPLPYDRPRRPDSRRPLGRHQRWLGEPAAAAIGSLAAGTATTAYTVLLAMTAASVAAWSGRCDLPFGSPRSGRDRPELEGVVGPFVNTLVLRMDLTGEPGAGPLIDRTRTLLEDAQAHADLPLEKLVECLHPPRVPGVNPLFQLNLGLGNFPRTALRLPQMLTEPVPLGSGQAKFDLAWYFTSDADAWHLNVEFDADLFDERTVEGLADRLERMLRDGAADRERPLLAEVPDPQGWSAPPPVPTRRIEPRDWWEWQVAQAFAEVLGLDEVSANDDFFRIGGHSMAGLLAARRLGERTGRPVTPAELFRNPRVEALAAALRGGGTVDPSPFLVALRPEGDRPTLWFVPAAVGELGMYFPMARAMAPGRPLGGLRSDGFVDGSAGVGPSLRAMAERYAREILEHRPDDPVHLVGFSAAGRTAVAVADRVRALGGRTGAVIAIDTAPFGDVEPNPDLPTVMARWLPFAPPGTELAALPEPELIARVLAAGHRTGDLPGELDTEQFGWMCRRLLVNARALAGHTRPGYPGRLTLLTRAAREERDLAAEWRALPVGEVRELPVDVPSHMDFVHGPRVPAVARAIEETLTDAEAAYGEPEGLR
ncbi:condensation domain-containing protein [Streptomyces sp. NPDC006435]|uniref:condensation domain-containing protein n=1 Tax=Streptomyces sp. NPDC006435 TaxID=3154300 RepID=UPI0033B9F89F